MAEQRGADRRTWSCLGCGSLGLGAVALFLFRDVGATDPGVFQGSWVLIVIGLMALIGVGISRMRDS